MRNSLRQPDWSMRIPKGKGVRMKFRARVSISNALIACLLVVTPNEGAFAATPSAKAGLATCATFDKIVAIANTFSNRTKSKNAAVNKAAATATLASLRSDFALLQSQLNAAIHLDSSYKSWQGPASVIESFNGDNGSGVGAAVITLMSYCAKLNK